jgi:uncharacterized protein YebE (UPF0316 family)
MLKMDFKLFILFIILTVLNVVVGTIKSIATIKGTKFVAAVINAIAYAINTISIVYTANDSLGMIEKISVVAITNFIGVYIVKFIEEKREKEKLWKIECTIPGKFTSELDKDLVLLNIPHSYHLDIGKYSIFNIYAATKKQSSIIKKLLLEYDAKYFVSESKILD